MRRALPLLVAVALLAGCGASAGRIDPSGVDGLQIPTPTPRAGDFVAEIDNPWLPLRPGTVWTYRVLGGSGVGSEVVRVTDGTAVVAGVTTTVVEEAVRDERGRLLATTTRWYAQDRAGNVWAFGADPTTYGVGRAGAIAGWTAGEAGAQAALAMPATPRVGDGYRTSWLPGVAEDRALVLSLTEQVVLGDRSWDGVLQLEQSSPLEPGQGTQRYYARGVGLVAARGLADGSPRLELVAFTVR